MALNDEDTKICVDCERAFLAALDGNCRTPIAAQVCVCVVVLICTHTRARALALAIALLLAGGTVIR